MDIPKRFKLMGRTVEVKYIDSLHQVTENMGEAHYRNNEIHLQSSTKGMHRPQSCLEQTFFHELVHFILFCMGEDNTEEKFVDTFSGLLHQAITTMEP